ncbi:MAG: UDP-N-acetylmuramate--L-alanine ligase [Chloroflexi bacterium]|nr:MAG: UDP-N-acetylmuramate--L-alanine ligase [Chloroflexota bacterium]
MAVQQNRNGVVKSWQERLVAQDRTLRVHLLGIGGAGLSAIARVLHEQGFVVSGSDRQNSAVTQRLAGLGIRVLAGQQAENLTAAPPAERPDVVLISSAVDGANPERQAAETLGIPVVKRADFLPVLLANRTVIAVAGTAGKSTTTAMIVKLLRDRGRDIGYIIGADLPSYGNAAAGRDPLFVVEADEYDHMFLGLRPAVAVITNVVWDHPDCYPTAERFWQAFHQFVTLVPDDGLVVTCVDDPGALRLYEQRRSPGPRWVTYGLGASADLRATGLRTGPGEQVADLVSQQAPVGELILAAPGAHNVCNALASLAVADFCHVSLHTALESLRTFGGTARRFEVKGEINGIIIIDDYAHHPLKVQATLAAARSRYPGRRVWAVFQPHTYSRTKELLADFAQSFSDADSLIVTDIYAAREKDDGTIHARDLVAATGHPQARYIGRLEDTTEHLAEAVRPADVVVVMGAGDSSRVTTLLVERLRQNGKPGVQNAE